MPGAGSLDAVANEVRRAGAGPDVPLFVLTDMRIYRVHVAYTTEELPREMNAIKRDRTRACPGR